MDCERDRISSWFVFVMWFVMMKLMIGMTYRNRIKHFQKKNKAVEGKEIKKEEKILDKLSDFSLYCETC